MFGSPKPFSTTPKIRRWLIVGLNPVARGETARESVASDV
jgi:hypothetical protein